MILYFIFIGILTLILFGYDKFSAKKNKIRISENTLLSFTLIGGTAGAVCGMIIFRHKVSKTSFLIKFGIVIFIQIVMIYFFKDYL